MITPSNSAFLFSKDDSHDIDDTIFKRFKDSHRLNLIHELSRREAFPKTANFANMERHSLI